MKYSFRGEKVTITSAIKAYSEEKLNRLNKYFKDSDKIEASVVISLRDKCKKIEVTIPTDKFVIRNEEENLDLYSAIDLLVDKLERQIVKNKKKIISKTKQIIFDIDSYEEEDEEETDIIKIKRVELKPTSRDEAILQMNMLDHTFFVYRDSDSMKVCVLYRRKDGGYGVIETD